MRIDNLKTGIHWPIDGGSDEAVEFACPYCHYVWLEYSSAEDYPMYCPGCGRCIDGEGKDEEE